MPDFAAGFQPMTLLVCGTESSLICRLASLHDDCLSLLPIWKIAFLLG